jgi:iron complex outermembrane receptor protein
MRKPATTNCSAPTPLAPGQINNQYKAIDANLDLVYGPGARARLQAPLRHGQRRRHRSALDPVGRQQSERVTSSLSWAEPQVTRDLGLGASLSTQQYSQEMPTCTACCRPDWSSRPAHSRTG